MVTTAGYPDTSFPTANRHPYHHLLWQTNPCQRLSDAPKNNRTKRRGDRGVVISLHTPCATSAPVRRYPNLPCSPSGAIPAWPSYDPALSLPRMYQRTERDTASGNAALARAAPRASTSSDESCTALANVPVRNTAAPRALAPYPRGSVCCSPRCLPRCAYMLLKDIMSNFHGIIVWGFGWLA